MEALVRHEWRVVTRALVEEAGENFVFAGLWCAASLDVVYPLADSRYFDAVGSADGGRGEGYEWVSSGMSAT